MNFEYTVSQKTFLSQLEDIIQADFLPVLNKNQNPQNHPDVILNVLRAHNLLCPIISKQYGGLELDYLTTALFLEKLAFYCPAAAFVVSTNIHVIHPLLIGGTKEQKQAILPDFTGPDACISAFACTEKYSGSDFSSFRSCVTPQKDGFLLNGQKDYILYSESCKYITVFARYAHTRNTNASMRCFIIPNSLLGIRAGQMRTTEAPLFYQPQELLFEDVHIPSFYALKNEDYSGFLLFGQTMDTCRPFSSAVALGTAKCAYSLALNFALQRTLSGKSLISNQSIAYDLIDMSTNIETTALLLYKACWQIDNNEDFALTSTMAKLDSSRMVLSITQKASEILSARALQTGSKMNQLFHFARIFNVVDGTQNIQKNTIFSILGEIN